ncbi:MAG: HAD family hydrolase [Ruminococcaceae bacterium]|nr:HAD family hydrolase [Oscillospiraceae bacterium]
MAMQGAIFDMDGTLLDSMEGWATAGQRYLERRGLVSRCGEADSLLYQGMIGAAQHFQREYGITDDVQTIIDGINAEVAAFYAAQATACNGVREFLQMLKDRGVKMCVATATDRCLAQPTLERLGLMPFFDCLFTCTELKTDKTVPLIYDTATAFMGTPKKQTWIFEDASYAVRTAKTAGYPVCAVYDRFEKRAEYLKSTADHYVRDYYEAMNAAF